MAISSSRSLAMRSKTQSFAPANEFLYTDQDFRTIAEIMQTHAGIALAREKTMLVYSRLTKYVRELKFASFAEYIELIRRDSQQRRRMIEALTTNHTRFFRENHHFNHFQTKVRPTLINKLIRGQRVRMWSAGCSSGEEVFTLLMTLLGSNRTEADRLFSSDLLVLASDLAEHVLNKAAKGEYPAKEADNFPEALRALWVRLSGEKMIISPMLRELVRFRRLNLHDAWPFQTRFDVIFCRNVMIYFDDPTKMALLDRFADYLPEGGYLYIGHSERLLGPAAERFTPVGQTIFRKLGQ
jgi:chemotaxis protein methyltransferase CheR